jgi:hypothetical protein
MKLGIIISTSFSNWNGQLEKEIYANFGDRRITEIIARSTKGIYKCIAMYAKKNKIRLVNVGDS